MKVAVISDIHANAIAFNSVYKSEPFQSAEKVLVCGDLIGYYYWPEEVLNIIQSDKRFLCIGGNHEYSFRNAISNEICANAYRQRYGSGFDFCNKLLSKSQIKWLTELPSQLNVEIGGVDFCLAHGTPGDPSQYLYPDAAASKIQGSYSDSKITCLGHTHYPFFHAFENKLLINPGSVGQPRDIGGLASYAILNTSNLCLQFFRVPFDIEPVMEAVALNDPHLNYLAEVMLRGRHE